MTNPLDLPASVLAMTELQPVEDLLLHVLREGLPDVEVLSLIPDDPPYTFILVRRQAGLGDYSGDPRFTDRARFTIHAFTHDPDGDEKGAVLSEAVRVVLRNAWLAHTTVPGLGSIIRCEMTVEPSRKTDWATATGPVQYADLPTGFHRYESAYVLSVRKPRR